MTLRHLRIFIAVYETLSFTKAGKQLFLAQPAVSLAIKEMEEYYGVPLFDRIKHTIHPTEYGEKCYRYAAQILSIYNEMEDFTKAWSNASTLKIGSSITIGNSLLPTLIKALKDQFPTLDIKVKISNSIAIENCILQNEIDFALIENEPIDNKIIKIAFMQDNLCTLVNKAHPFAEQKEITLEQLSKQPFLMREKGSSVRELVESIFIANQLPIQPQWESTSTQALLRAVENNLGITTLPYQLIKDRYDKNKVVLLDIPKLNLQRNYNIIYYQDKYLVREALAFFDICQRKGNLAP